MKTTDKSRMSRLVSLSVLVSILVAACGSTTEVASTSNDPDPVVEDSVGSDRTEPETSSVALKDSLFCIEQDLAREEQDLLESGDVGSGPTVQDALQDLHEVHAIFTFQADLLAEPPITEEMGKRARAVYLDDMGRRTVLVELKQDASTWQTTSLVACAR